MTHKKLLLGIIILMVASLALVGVACCGGGDEVTPTPTPTATATATATGEPTEEPTTTPPPSGGAPTLKVGDTWTYTVTWNEEVSTFVGSVTSATAGYEILFVFDETERKEKLTPLNLPVFLLGEITRTYNGDMDMLTQDIWSEVVGYGELMLSLDITTAHAAAKWPLAVGTEWVESWALMVGDHIYEDAWDYNVVVESVEDVTVPAGTFECYKIVSYEGDTVRITDWYSEDVKASVKKIEECYFHGEDIWELESYTAP